MMETDFLLKPHKPDRSVFKDIMQLKQDANRAGELVRQLLASRASNHASQVIDLGGDCRTGPCCAPASSAPKNDDAQCSATVRTSGGQGRPSGQFEQVIIISRSMPRRMSSAARSRCATVQCRALTTAPAAAQGHAVRGRLSFLMEIPDRIHPFAMSEGDPRAVLSPCAEINRRAAMTAPSASGSPHMSSIGTHAIAAAQTGLFLHPSTRPASGWSRLRAS